VRRFVDAPEVARTAERGVTLTIPAAEAAVLPPPESGPGTGGVMRRLVGGRRRR
jgi:glycerate kinase